MSTVDSSSLNQTHQSMSVSRPHTLWILNAPDDFLLITSPPLLIVPLIMLIQSNWIGVEVETISLVVLAFGALGHHFPGMIRAYCDRELFARFRMRFILSPIIIFVGFFPLYFCHPSTIKLVLSTWGCWHGLMQLYGFVRIYDAKVGSTSPVTSYLDWLLCLCSFSTAQLFSPAKLSALVGSWYDLGGAMIAPGVIAGIRICSAAILGVVVTAFLVNHVVQCSRGHAPNPMKLILLINGIGLWWYAMVFVDNLILGLAIFEVFHDVQYLTIVWLFNCRRVNADPKIGTFMTLVFRQGMLAFYLALVFCYGLIGLVPHFTHNGSIKVAFTALLWTSTILHYYYDGFIWKVREKTTRASLGLSVDSRVPRVACGTLSRMAIMLKWSPVIAGLSWLLFLQYVEVPLSAATKESLSQTYTQQLCESSVVPAGVDEQSWLFRVFERAQGVAAAVPDDPRAQQKAAISLANFGRKKEAIQVLRRSLDRNPRESQSHLVLGAIWQQIGQADQALNSYQAAIECARSREDRVHAHQRIGEVYAEKKLFDLAKSQFQAALRDDESFLPSRQALDRLNLQEKAE